MARLLSEMLYLFEASNRSEYIGIADPAATTVYPQRSGEIGCPLPLLLFLFCVLKEPPYPRPVGEPSIAFEAAGRGEGQRSSRWTGL